MFHCRNSPNHCCSTRRLPSRNRRGIPVPPGTSRPRRDRKTCIRRNHRPLFRWNSRTICLRPNSFRMIRSGIRFRRNRKRSGRDLHPRIRRSRPLFFPRRTGRTARRGRAYRTCRSISSRRRSASRKCTRHRRGYGRSGRHSIFPTRRAARNRRPGIC